METPETSSEGLLSAAALGDQGAFARLVELHQAGLESRFLRQGLDTEAARDCAQETFLRLHRAAPGYRPRAPFSAFLTLLARNVLIDWRRRRHRRQDRELDLDAALAEQLSAAPPADLEPLDLVAALARLPASQRRVVQLRFAAGLDLAAIAEELGIPVGTVKSRLHHGLRRLREDLS